MPLYQYQCPEHGIADVIKPMAEAGRAECCRVLVQITDQPWADGDTYQRLYHHKAWQCALPMRRIYNPQRIIMRPSGWNLRPGDKNYSNFDRELELGEVRSPGDKSESGGTTVARPTPRVDHSAASVAAERNLRQAVEAAIVEV